MSNEKSAIRSAIEELADRRLDPRVRATAGYFWRRWVALSAFRRAVVTLLMAGAVGGTTFAACQSSSITGPAESSAGTISRDLAGDGGSLIGGVVNLVSIQREVSEEEAALDRDYIESTHTIFPTTEPVYNVCMNEAPVLNGEIHVKTRLKFDGLTMKYTLRSWKNTHGVFATATTYQDDDRDPTTPPKEVVVKYVNHQRYLDEFEVGPAGLPYETDQEDRIFLHRQGDDGSELSDDDHGDDMLVIARQRVRINQNGIVHEKIEYRTECK